jgi:hypothetical protein
MVLGHSRMMWGRFVAHQDLQTVLRCHIAAFEALGGVPAEILYDRMKTAVLGEVDDHGIAYNRKLLGASAGIVHSNRRGSETSGRGKSSRT